jgi:hypothetical protein
VGLGSLLGAEGRRVAKARRGAPAMSEAAQFFMQQFTLGATRYYCRSDRYSHIAIFFSPSATASQQQPPSLHARHRRCILHLPFGRGMILG